MGTDDSTPSQPAITTIRVVLLNGLAYEINTPNVLGILHKLIKADGYLDLISSGKIVPYHAIAVIELIPPTEQALARSAAAGSA